MTGIQAELPPSTRGGSAGEGTRPAWWIALGVAWLLSSLYLWYYLDRGWVPFDDGALAHGAERVLRGELPHRDYNEVYTGGLSYLNALAFRVFGIHLMAIRYVFFGFFLLWIPALYYSASRLAGPPTAAVVTILGVLWSVPNYPAAMPSWYNLFFATFGLAAFLAYLRAPRPGFLFLAGLAGGLSVLAKTSGFFFVGAGVLGLVYYAARQPTPGDSPGLRRLPFLMVGGLPLAAAAAVLLAIGLSRREWEDLYHFTLPGLALVSVIGVAVARATGNAWWRSRRLAAMGGWYLLGVLVPIGSFLLLYAAQGAVPDLVRGTLSMLSTRFAETAVPPSSPLYAAPAVGIALLVLVGTRLPPRLSTVHLALVIAGLAVGLRLATHRRVHDLIFDSLAQALPLVIVALSLLIARARSLPESAPSQWLFVGVTAALCSLVQYPFAAPIYFCYVVPLLLLALIPVTGAIPGRKQPALSAIAGFYLIFGALDLEPFRLEGLGGPLARENLEVLNLPRGGLRMGVGQARWYREAVDLLRDRAATGVIYSGPDGPEMYFLAELRNPTPAIFDFLVPDSLFHPRLVADLDRHGISAVALKHDFIHSPPLDSEVVAAFERRFPEGRRIGVNFYTIRWAP